MSSNRLSWNRLAGILQVPSPDAFISRLEEIAMLEHIEREEEESDEAYEERRNKIENSYLDEACKKYFDAIESVAEKLFAEHKLTLTLVKEEGEEEYFLVSPEKAGVKGWYRAAQEVIQTINGYGMFEFTSVRDFYEASSEATLEATVIGHLPWLKKWYEVYGEPNAQCRIDKLMR